MSVESGLALLPSFIEVRIVSLQNESVLNIQQFIRLYVVNLSSLLKDGFSCAENYINVDFLLRKPDPIYIK